MKKFVKRVIALAMSLALVVSLVPVTVSANDLVSWQDVLDTGLFAVNSAWQGDPVLSATDAGLVVSDRAPTGNEGEHHGLAFNLAALRAIGSGDDTIIVFSAHVEGEDERMWAQAFDGLRGRGDEDWPRGDIDAAGNFSITIGPNEVHGVPTWAAWAEMPWIGAHPRGDITITEITIDGVPIREVLAVGDVYIPEAEIIDFGFPAGILYSFLLDPFIQGLTQGETTDLADVPTFAVSGSVDAGNSTRTVVPNPFGGNAIQVTEREEDFAAIDLLWRTLNLPDGRYSIQVVGNVEDEDAFVADFALAGTVSPWAWIGMGSAVDYEDEDGSILTELDVDTGDFSMVRDFSVIDGVIVHELWDEYGEVIEGGNGPIGGNIRLFTPLSTNNYTIYQIVIVAFGDELPGEEAPLEYEPAEASLDAGTGEVALRIGSTSANVEGTPMTLEVAPFIERNPDRTMVPLRFVADAMGADDVAWDEATNTVTIFFAGEVITIIAGDELPDDLGTAVIRDGRTFVPVRFVAVEMGADVAWDAATQTVTITLP